MITTSTEHGFGICQHTDFDCTEKTCCEKYGNCNQGRTCPTITGIITPAQRAYMDAAAGNVVFVGDEPEFTTLDGCMKMAGRCAGYLVALIVLAGLAGYVWARWAA